MMIKAGDTGLLLAAAPDDFLPMRDDLVRALLEAPIVHPAHWQQLDVSESPAHATHELLNVTLWYDMPQNIRRAQLCIRPDLPWAEGHFRERVAGEAVNPGEWHDKWPYHAGQVELHQHGGKYDHNYMERIWPTRLEMEITEDPRSPWIRRPRVPFTGYRFNVGDLDDVIKQLIADPTTRQAYLPIWFPEDTGATQGQRVPCSLGYHFIIRNDQLHMSYYLRSCEIYRHFTNDVYMAVRLAQWVKIYVSYGLNRSLRLGQLSMHIVSMHAFVGDVPVIREMMLP